MDKIIKEAYEYGKQFTKNGKLVDYLPDLTKANINKLGLAIVDENGKIHEEGEVNEKFAIMSIVKVILYLMALENYDYDEILKYVGIKPSSKAYNSLLDLEMGEDKKPINPFINAGAIVTSYLLFKKFADKTVEKIIERTRTLMESPDINYSKSLVETSMAVADSNFAMTYTLKKNKIIGNDISAYDLLLIYCKACSLMINTRELAKFASLLSRGGKNYKGEQIVSEKNAQKLRVLMATCGTYNFAGEFAMDVGLPAKSGVGGGLIATTNKGLGIAAYSPGLDELGNPLAPMKVLKYLSEKLNLSIY
ncbi:glutaminase A [uncultured Peptoniphilus sp.]|uniref:glutaminase A n=1 Tax=uncultured Peptoniphilus sp. TaxID=254354 RepID=UPI002805609B|nr:glutaminase A [uncultured Peptoniphilus sp.]